MEGQRCKALLEKCRSLRFTDPEGMVLAASFAVTWAERLATDQEQSEEVADLLAQAWAELGNAHRVADDLFPAEIALGRALAASGDGTGDPKLLARLMDLTASLFTAERRFEDACGLLDCVHAVYQHVGDTHSAARALISKGICVSLTFESEKAMSLLAQGVLNIDPARDPKLTLAAVHGLLCCLVDCGRTSEARALFDISQPLYRIHGGRLEELRARWLEGRIAADLGEDGRAEQILLQVREDLKKVELPYGTANVSLDLAAIWLRQGRTAKIKEAVDEMVAVFRARNIQREALGALLMLKLALQMNQATADVLQAVSTEFRRLERQPVLRDRTSSSS